MPRPKLYSRSWKSRERSRRAKRNPHTIIPSAFNTSPLLLPRKSCKSPNLWVTGNRSKGHRGYCAQPSWRPPSKYGPQKRSKSRSRSKSKSKSKGKSKGRVATRVSTRVNKAKSPDRLTLTF